MAAASRRPAAWVCAVVVLLSGCTYGSNEPGLFNSPEPSTRTPVVRRDQFQPQPTNPALPVAGERLWVSGFSALPITFRFAVHAVRRIEEATVLDWSITPVGAPNYDFGEGLPSTELGLEPAGRSAAGVLLDPAAGQVYQPLRHRQREQFNHCLCTPLLRLQPTLRVGETRLLQTTFPALPRALTHVDVGLAHVAPVRHVPVSPVGTAPVARVPTDLARPGVVLTPGRDRITFPNPSRSEQFQQIGVNRVLTAPGRTTLEWTLLSVDDQVLSRVLAYEPPVARHPPAADVVNLSPANGAVLRVGSKRLTNLWARTEVNNRTTHECRCTEIGLWASGLRDAGVSVQLVTDYPELPAGTRTVDVEFPGFGTLRGVEVVPVEDAARQLGPSGPAETGRWTFSLENPPYGWPTSEWPTDTPDPEQLADYERRVEPLVTLPATS